MPLLEIKNLRVSYGAVKALENVSIQVFDQEIIALIGPNGAGKSTAIKAIGNLLKNQNGRIDKGDIFLDGESILGYRTDTLVRKGIGFVPEGRRLFHSMTVIENLEMGGYLLKTNREVRDKIESIFVLLPKLKERYRQKAGTLSTGEQQMLALGRALMLNPRLLLADEPSVGLSPNYVELIFEKLIEINEDGVSILLVEQNVFMALETAHRAYVFEIGKIALEGSCRELVDNSEVKRTFFGE